MNKFKKGDRVEAIRDYCDIPKGSKGTVLDSNITPDINFDNNSLNECCGGGDYDGKNYIAITESVLKLIVKDKKKKKITTLFLLQDSNWDDEDFGRMNFKVFITKEEAKQAAETDDRIFTLKVQKTEGVTTRKVLKQIK